MDGDDRIILIAVIVTVVVAYIIATLTLGTYPFFMPQSVNDPFHEVISRCEACLSQFPEVECDYFNESNTCMALKGYCSYNCTGDFLNHQDAFRWAGEDCMAYNANHTNSSCWV